VKLTKIASAAPFAGAPKINLPSVFGASPKKPFLLRIAATGERPISFSSSGLPEGLTLRDNIIFGCVEREGEYKVTLCAHNAHGENTKNVTIEIRDGSLLITPLLGFTSWNAFGSEVTEEKMLQTAHRLVQLGITEYGYSYINLDSGWQYRYGGKFDAIMPNSKFPDMKAMTDGIHALGLKCGIYSTPMLRAWGCPKTLESIPGCTQGEADKRFTDQNGGIGVIRKEANNVKQWEEWGFDYLKYDWTPTDPVNAEYMREELVKSSRDFGFCVTVRAMKEYHSYWSKYCNSYRSNSDSLAYWENLLGIYKTYFTFAPYINRGHYFDLDMLDVGTCTFEQVQNALNEDEQIIAYTMRAFLASPIQISSTLENIDDFELSLYCNEEMIAINQDAAFSAAELIFQKKCGKESLDVFERKLEDGCYAYAFFNLTEEELRAETAFAKTADVRDVWAKEDIANGEKLALTLYPHTVRVIKCTEKISEYKA